MRSPFTWMGLGIAVIVALQVTAPKPISWTYTYEGQDKNPYGGWIAQHYLDRIIAGDIRSVKSSWWADTASPNLPRHDETYVIITHDFSPDNEASRRFINFVRSGGTLFIASDKLSDSVASSFGVETRSRAVADTMRMILGDTTVTYAMHAFNYANTFTSDDTLTWQALARCDTSVVMARRQFGKGVLILCGTPDVLTNKSFLDSSTRRIPVAILSALPAKPVVWDEYYKPKHADDVTVNKAIGAIPGLSLAYWILVCTGFLYLLLAGRRRQRPIPIVHPVRNTSLDFVSTVGRLYFRRHDNQNLSSKLSRLFRDHVVNRLRLRIDVDTETLAQNISAASGADIALVNDILRRVSHADSGLEFSDEETVAFHNDILKFQQQSTI